MIFIFWGGFIARSHILLSSCRMIANLTTSQFYDNEESLATFASIFGIKQSRLSSYGVHKSENSKQNVSETTDPLQEFCVSLQPVCNSLQWSARNIFETTEGNEMQTYLKVVRQLLCMMNFLYHLAE